MSTARGATFTVTVTQDAYHGVCSTACSLRDALAAATRQAGPDTIVLPAGVFLVTRPDNVTYDFTDGDLDVFADVEIVGGGRAGTVIESRGSHRIIEVHNGASLRLRGLTLRDGVAPSGGAIRVRPTGALTLEDCVLEGNVSPEHGGAVFNEGVADVRNCTISGNSALGFGDGGGVYNASSATLNLENTIVSGNSARNGAGIHNEGTVVLIGCTLSNGTGHGIGVGGALFNRGTAALSNCTLSGNATFGGAGVFNRAGASVTLENCTLSGNVVSGFGRGGGVYNRGAAAVRNCTFSGNTAAGGANIFNGNTTTLANTIVAGGLGGPSCVGTMTSDGHNLDESGECNLAANGDLSGVMARLAPLADYGGPTRTHALCLGPSLPAAACAAASAAIDAGDDLNCPGADQRGAPRLNGARCDIGAFESGSEPAGRCHGDCGTDGAVTVDDLLQAIEIALGNASADTCRQADSNADTNVTIEEIVIATTSALNGCR